MFHYLVDKSKFIIVTPRPIILFRRKLETNRFYFIFLFFFFLRPKPLNPLYYARITYIDESNNNLKVYLNIKRNDFNLTRKVVCNIRFNMQQIPVLHNL